MTNQRLWDRHVFVCANQRELDHPRGCCGAERGQQTVVWFKEAIKKANLSLVVRANKSGCLEACESGPAVVVYPDAVWYRVQNQTDVEQIVQEHLQHGRIVQSLLLDFSPLPAWQARQKRNP